METAPHQSPHGGGVPVFPAGPGGTEPHWAVPGPVSFLHDTSHQAECHQAECVPAWVRVAALRLCPPQAQRVILGTSHLQLHLVPSQGRVLQSCDRSRIDQPHRGPPHPRQRRLVLGGGRVPGSVPTSVGSGGAAMGIRCRQRVSLEHASVQQPTRRAGAAPAAKLRAGIITKTKPSLDSSL